MSILIETFFKKDNIIIELENLNMEKSEKEQILKIADELADYQFLNAILDKLEEKDKEIFLERMHGGTPEGVAEFLHERIEGIEEVLKENARALELEIIEDIRSLQRSSQ